MLSLRVLSKIIEKNHAWILVLWCWFFWKIFGGHLGQTSKIVEKIHAWILVFQCFWRGLDERRIRFGGGLARFLVFKTSVFAAILPIEIGHTWEGPIPTIPLMLRFSNTLDLRCHFAWWQYCTACALESCWWSYWELDGLANPWLRIETCWRKSK